MSTAAKIHVHDDQLDGRLYAHCGRNTTNIVTAGAFEATNPTNRCKVCERWWFPHGQPQWHQEQAERRHTDALLREFADVE